MTLNLVFLPLLGGYIFFSWFRGTRYRASGFPAQRILFPSAAYGLVFLIAAQCLNILASWMAERPHETLLHSVGFAIPAAGALVIVSVICGAFSIVFNFGRGFAKDSDAANSAQLSVPSILERSLRGPSTLRIVQALLPVIVSSWLIHEVYAIAAIPRHDWLIGVGTYAATLVFLAGIFASWLSNSTGWSFSGILFRTSSVILIIVCALAVFSIGPLSAASAWGEFSPVDQSGVPILALAIAVASVGAGNLILTPDSAATYYYLTGRFNELQKLLFESAAVPLLIQLNLDDNKVYIGWVRSVPARIESADGFVLFLPLKSGHRDKDSRRLVIDTDYARILADLANTSESADDLNVVLENYYKVVRVTSIKTAGRFSETDYLRFSLGSSPGSTAGSGSGGGPMHERDH